MTMKSLHLSKSKLLISLCIVIMMLVSHSDANVLDDDTASSTNINLITDEALDYDWPLSTYEYDEDDDNEFDAGQMEETRGGRRSLFWRRLRRYYISYGVLFANRIPCPARSGRSYYTPNCFKATGPVHPYTRGCSAITRCRS